MCAPLNFSYLHPLTIQSLCIWAILKPLNLKLCTVGIDAFSSLPGLFIWAIREVTLSWLSRSCSRRACRSNRRGCFILHMYDIAAVVVEAVTIATVAVAHHPTHQAAYRQCLQSHRLQIIANVLYLQNRGSDWDIGGDIGCRNCNSRWIAWRAWTAKLALRDTPLTTTRI
jgi:hypothetical protein